ncbi:MAG TPA: multidrug efflux MFS transporter [Firmicutes bacterium]|nr:multidrug efflux MFS transporter [Bacillota bacterium]
MHWRRNVWVLSAGTLIAQIAFSLTMPFLPMYLSELGLTRNISLWSGLMFSINFLTFGVMAPIWGSLSDRYGKRIMLMRSGLGIAATYVLMGVARNHIQLFVLRGANGLVSGYIPAAISLVATTTPEDDLGFALGMVQTANAVGLICGPVVGGAVAQLAGIRGTFFFAAALLAVASFLGFFMTSENVTPSMMRSTVMTDVRSALENPALRVLYAVLFLVQAGTLAIQPTLPLFISEMVRSNVEMITGIIFSLVGISTAIGAPLVSRVPHAKYPATLEGALIIAGILTALQAFTRSALTLGLIRFLFGFVNAAISVTANVLVAYASPKDARGRAYGVLNSVTAVGAVVGPLLGGFLGERFGLASSFYGSGALLGIAGILVASGCSIIAARSPGECGDELRVHEDVIAEEVSEDGPAPSGPRI